MLKNVMTNTVLVGKGLRALLTLPQNRVWARSLLSLLFLNLLIFVLWKADVRLPGAGAIKVAADPTEPEWIAIHAPWRKSQDDGDQASQGSIKTQLCRRWGPFNAIDIRRVEQLLAEWGGQRKLITETEPIAYQVYWPESARDTAKFMKELRLAGFADAVVSTGEDPTRGHVTYGTFRGRGQAKAKIDYLSSKGFPGATVFTRMGPPKTVYELRGDEEQLDELREIRSKYDFGELTGCNSGGGRDEAAH
jgi:hypothetical protein